ncbi:uncharacterized protein LOC131957910 [Physella acuta]|uniref:uncharacterized protein LOC131957910 n=1 Tax=Physella acuta TaxID=109671 RepID=UPI0027DD27AF|nr:uncharacterized protein LOC131957910 [Physella acuta]XP_059178734.1 uncharacterized protein LOC131957910 [Physella acuta]XP_059178735.1 uncharacterized protein LOC131957910 [Physella acuta]
MKTYVYSVRLVCVLACLVMAVDGHGRLWDPPSRSSMWRRGYNTPVNYQDNELFCGGFSHQVSLGYKCGLCGDPYDGVRENEEGGRYATGLVTRTYTQGQRATIQVDITANHKGYFEFKICPTNNPKVRTTQDCLDRYPLQMADGSGTHYKISAESKMFYVDVILPADLTCDFCVLQWRYHAGNNWGQDPDGKQCVGCGYQEEFYGCADIRILPAGSSGAATFKPVYPATQTFKPVYTATQTTPRTSQPQTTKRISSFASAKTSMSSGSSSNGVASQINGEEMSCTGVAGRRDLDTWCQVNCQVGNCPSTHCTCRSQPYVYYGERPAGCRAAGAYAAVPGYDNWCMVNCAADYCPKTICVCT